MKQKLLAFFIGAFYATQVMVAQSPNEKTAQNWIKQNTKKFNIQPHHNFKMLFNRKGPSGETLRYYQMVNDVQVYDAEFTIHINTIVLIFLLQELLKCFFALGRICRHFYR